MRCRGSIVALAALLACGCTRQEQSQRALIGEMRKAIGDVKSWNDERQALVEASYAQRRKSLDDAFDADVKESAALEKDWVIEHRRAYVAAMEATWRAQQASVQAHQRTQENLAGVDDGLARLGMMSEMREGWIRKAGELGKEVGNGAR